MPKKKEPKAKKKPIKKTPAIQAAMNRMKTIDKRVKDVLKDQKEVNKQLNTAIEDQVNPKENPYEPEEEAAKLTDLNHTELAQLCRERGFGNVSRDTPEEIMIMVLEQNESSDLLGDPIDRLRKAVEKFLEAYPTVRPQLRCDEHHAACPPTRVIDCFLSAPEIVDFYE